MTAMLTNYLAAGPSVAALRRDVFEGLWQTPKSLPSKWLYDEVGSDLFDRLTRVPEYYITRTEAAILAAHAPAIAEVSGADTLVELGSGTSAKTRMLLDAMRDRGALRRFIPFDVDAGVLQSAGEAIAAEYPGVEVDAVCGDFEKHLGEIPCAGRRLVAFYGATIGNMRPCSRGEFLARLAAVLRPGDSFLLGIDLVKDVGRMVRAYDDSAGAMAALSRNVLAVVNRELDADFEQGCFEHVSKWNATEERVEICLRSTRAQTVRVGDLGRSVGFDAGEEMLTAVSYKFRPEGVAAELAAAGLRQISWWTDPAGDCGLSLAVK